MRFGGGEGTQAEDLVAGGVKEFIHVGLAGGINQELSIGDVVLTNGAYNDTAVARLYGFDYDFLETTPSLTDEIEQLLKEKEIQVKRGGIGQQTQDIMKLGNRFLIIAPKELYA